MNSNWSYSPETAKLGYDLCDLDLWPCPFAWTSLLSLVITPENSVMIRWWEHSQKGVTYRQTDGRTDGQTDWTIHRAAWSQLKTHTSRWCSKPKYQYKQVGKFLWRWQASILVLLPEFCQNPGMCQAAWQIPITASSPWTVSKSPCIAQP